MPAMRPPKTVSRKNPMSGVLLLFFVFFTLADGGCRVSPRRANYFLLRRQEKVGKEKASRSQGPFGLPCAARAGRGIAQTRLRLKQGRSLIRPSLCCSALPTAL